eukprot:TRINITY_DN811_c0_g1_i1.p1 TRINITY_DN811_c0_g1~~TRINITY_DN811_c0_g1_i1.p1  ORF type:complete len:1282 (-),score=153.48 TRINITY_DN811_c0_g1_i1:358-3852(-)
MALRPENKVQFKQVKFVQEPFPEYQAMIQACSQQETSDSSLSNSQSNNNISTFITTNSNRVPDFGTPSDSSDLDDVSGRSPRERDSVVLFVIERGKDLLPCDGGLSDPFCEVIYGGSQQCTAVCNRTLAPLWNYSGQFALIQNQPLQINCWDKGLMDPDTFIGTIVLNADQLKRGVQGWFPLQKVDRGHLYIKAKLSNLNSPNLDRQYSDMQGREQNSSQGQVLESSMLRQSTEFVSVEVRLNPLNPKNCAKLSCLSGFGDTLVAGPSLSGGLLIWSGAETLPTMPFGAVQPAQGEDSDNAGAGEIVIPGCGPISCLYFDQQCNNLWSGHEDGRVCQWNVVGGKVPTIVKSWQAHRVGAVMAIGVTMWGDVWTGSAWGSLRIWPGAVYYLEGELRSKELRKAGKERAHSEVLFLVLSKSGQTVWTASPNTVNVWDAYTGLFLGTVNRTGNQDVSEVFINPSYGLDPSTLPAFGIRDLSEADVLGGNRGMMDRLSVQGAKAAKMLRKFGTSKTMADDTANGVQSVADIQTKYSVTSMCSALDGCIWVGCRGGRYEQYTYLGQCLLYEDMHTGISFLTSVGNRIWMGLADGQVYIIEQDGSPLKLISMHDQLVASIQVVGPLVYTLGVRGQLRGWSSWAPSPADKEVQSSWLEASHGVVQNQQIQILCGSWNVNESRPSPSSIQQWLSMDKLKKVDLVVVGLQEVEMGTGSVAAAAAKERVYKQWLEQGNRNAQWWATEIQNAVSADGQEWFRVGLRQLSGMLIVCLARKALQENIGDVLTASVACGVAGIGGNKGAVAVSFQLFRHRLAFVNSHFAAHQNAVDKRNADYATIVKNLKFSEVTEVKTEQQEDGGDVFEPGQGMRDSEILVWLGDFNYRIDQTREDTENFLQHGDLGELQRSDQCAKEMQLNHIFHGLREGVIKFWPTYKYDKNTPGQMAYDSGEKRRIPAWTDRIFFRGSQPFKEYRIGNEDGMYHDTRTLQSDPEEIVVRALDYNCCVDVIESDHKPVWATLYAEVPVIQQEVKRRECAKILQRAASTNYKYANIECRQNKLQLQQGSAGTIILQNTGEADGSYMFCGINEGQLPDWLLIQPIYGNVPAGQTMKVQILAVFSDREFFLGQDQIKEATILYQWSEMISVGGKSFGQDRSRMQSIDVRCTQGGGLPF